MLGQARLAFAGLVEMSLYEPRRGFRGRACAFGRGNRSEGPSHRTYRRMLTRTWSREGRRLALPDLDRMDAAGVVLLAIVSLDDDGGPLFEPWWLEWLEMNRIGGGGRGSLLLCLPGGRHSGQLPQTHRYANSYRKVRPPPCLAICPLSTISFNMRPAVDWPIRATPALPFG